MSIRKKHIIRHYTIVEVMVAMGIFLIMMTIMMQFFNSAQKVWNLASKKNMMYADARVAMNLMTRELQSMLFKNTDTDGSDIYPFWYEWTETDVDLTGTESITTELEDHWVDNKDLSEKVVGASPKDAYLTSLNFIATTDIKAVDAGSDVCEIRYKFIPIYFETASPTSANDVKGGKLVRSCTAEYYDATTLTNVFKSTTTPYNFSTYYYRGDVTTVAAIPLGTSYRERVATIWRDATDDLDVAPFQTVITGVYSLRFTCYFWNETSNALETLEPMNRTAPGKSTNNSNITIANGFPIAYDLATGTPAPVAIRIDMKLMDPKDLKKLAYYIHEGNTKQIKVLKQTMRTFSKVIYLGKR